MKKNIETIVAILLALLMIIFGLNKFFGFIAVSPPADPTAQKFMGAMFNSYLYVVVGIAEIVSGILLLISRFRFVGWLLMGVIIFNIVAFHIAHDFIGNGIWLLPTILFLILGYFQFYKIVSLFNLSNYESQINLSKSASLLILVIATINTNVTAQDNYQSFKVENEIIVDQAPNNVWQLISDFKNLSKLVPNVVKKTEVNGEGVYTSWNIFLQNDQIVKEEMTYFNPIEMELCYIMTKRQCH